MEYDKHNGNNGAIMKCEETKYFANGYRITDQFGDHIFLTEKEMLELYSITEKIIMNKDKDNGSNDR